MNVGERPVDGRVRYWPAIDGLRGVAIALVVLFHVDLSPAGFLGVDVFFTLSGFLITSLLLAELDDRGSVSLRHFWTRRALRLVPALTVTVVAYIAAMALLQRLTADRTLGAIYGLIYVSNWTQALGVQSLGPSHLWSLATEEQFYLLWPPTLLLLVRRSRAVVVRFLVGATVLLIVWRVLLVLQDVPWERLYFAPDTRAPALLIGCVLAFYVTDRPSYGERALGRDGIAIAALMLIVVFAWTIPDHESLVPYLGGLEAVALATAVLVVVSVRDEHSIVTRFLSLRPIVMLGKISYSLYLLHPLATTAVEAGLPEVNPGISTLLALAASVLAAAASYVFIEEPFLRRKNRFARYRPTRPVALSETSSTQQTTA